MYKLLFRPVILGLAALALVLPAGASARVPDDRIGKLRLDFVAAYKYEGYQPLDVLARVVDKDGKEVNDAEVHVTFDLTASAYKPDIILKSIGNGYYLGCDIDDVDSPVAVTVEARKKGSVSATTKVNTQAGNQCGAGEPQFHVSEPVAAKPDGERQPLDILVDLTDESGNLIEGAKVMARATDFETFVDAPLTDLGNGRYGACAFGLFNGKGAGAIRIHIRAEKTGYRPGSSDGTSMVGTLCMQSSASGPSR